MAHQHSSHAGSGKPAKGHGGPPHHAGEEVRLQYSLPLYDYHGRLGFFRRDTPLQVGSGANVALVFDKFVDGWEIDPGGSVRVPKPASGKKATTPEAIRAQDGGKLTFYKRVRDLSLSGKNVTGPNLAHSLRTIDALVSTLGGRTIEEASTSWRLVSGLGSGHPFETGLVWHPVLGVPYLPGSGLKGMVRAWASQWDAVTKEEVVRLFGPVDEDARRTPAAGLLIVFDALPVLPPVLDVDIMNPHYAPYYSEERGATPADYHSPTPIFFLAVAPGQRFRFWLALRPLPDGHPGRGMEADLDRAENLLRDALTTIGAGGKTGVGYGAFDCPTTNKGEGIVKAGPALEGTKPGNGERTPISWPGAVASWDKGRSMLVVVQVAGGPKATARLDAHSPLLSGLSESDRVKLLEKRKEIACDAVVEPIGSEWTVVGVRSRQRS